MTVSLRLHSLLALLLLGAIGPACAAPVLPLPPPTALVSSPDMDGFVTVTGEVSTEGAFVGCLNEDTEVGILVRSDSAGMYACRLRADIGHLIRIWQFVDTGPGGQPTFEPVPPPDEDAGVDGG